MVKKIIGYVLAGIGLVGLLATSVPKIWSKVPIPASMTKILTQGNVLILSIALVGISFFILKGTGGFSKKQKVSEVPIYHGNQVVGFRRIQQPKK